MARPSKYDEKIKPKLELIGYWARDGMTDVEIAKKLGIANDTFYRWKREHCEFSETLKRGKEKVDYDVENALLKAALEGNTTAQIFWLKNRRPKMWRDKPEVKDEGPVRRLDSLCSAIDEVSRDG